MLGILRLAGHLPGNAQVANRLGEIRMGGGDAVAVEVERGQTGVAAEDVRPDRAMVLPLPRVDRTPLLQPASPCVGQT